MTAEIYDSTWRATTLGALVAETGGVIQTGPFGSQLHASDYVPVGTPLIMPVNLGDNVIVEQGIMRVGRKDANRLKRHALREGDIVFSRRGDVGRRSIVRLNNSGWLCGTGCLAARFGSKRETVLPEYIAIYLGTRTARAWLEDNAVGGTMPNLNTGILSSVPIFVPSIRAQAQIVDMLTDTGKSIATLERLIAKKQAIKQGMMQQLLTGETRLPGFNGEWGSVRLGSLFERIESGVSVNSTSDPGLYSVLKTSCVSAGRFHDAECKTVAPADLKRAKLNPRSDSIIISRMNTPDLVGEVGYVPNDYMNLFLPDRLWMATAKSGNYVHMRWLAYLLSSSKYSRLIKELATGTSGSMKNISKSSFLDISVAHPPREEQVAIAHAISDLERQVDVLRFRLEKATSVKHGMMQELLTGRTRLQPAEASA